MADRKAPPATTRRVGPSTRTRAGGRPPAGDGGSGRALIGGAAALVVVALLVLGAVVLGIGPFAPRPTPSPSPFTGSILSPRPSIVASGAATATTFTGAPTASTATPRPTRTPARTPTRTPTPRPTVGPTGSATAPPTGTAPPTPTAPPTATPTPAPTATPPTAPPSDTPPPTESPVPTPTVPVDTPTPAPTDAPSPTPESSQIAFGPLDRQARAAAGFLISTLLTGAEYADSGLTPATEPQAGSRTRLSAAFAANSGRIVVGQRWTGTGDLRNVLDVRFAFPKARNAIPFLPAFGEERAAAGGLTESQGPQLGQESRSWSRIVTLDDGSKEGRFLFVWRRGDLVGAYAVAIDAADEQFAAGAAAGLAGESAARLDAALGIPVP